MAKTIDEKMAVDKTSVDTNDNDDDDDDEEEEEEEERGGGGLRKRRRNEEEEEEKKEEEIKEEDTSVMRLDLPPGHQEHQKFVDHTICLANHTNRKGCFKQN